MSAINVEETLRGLFPRERERARSLFSGLRVVPLDLAAGWRAGGLATGNPRDYPMAELSIEHWPVGG